MGNHFWARFKEVGDNMFRYDTRIYLNEISEPQSDDLCIGAVIGKNPGSAKPSADRTHLQAISLDGDKMLPTIKNILVAAHHEAALEIGKRDYVQVLNLFYLCNADLKAATRAIKDASDLDVCPSEDKVFPWVWYVWGGSKKTLNGFKERFTNINSETHFYLDHSTKEVVCEKPTKDVCAKHTQGMIQEPIIRHFKKLLISTTNFEGGRDPNVQIPSTAL